ncbi:MAG: UMP kinase [FCB group bacterium]|nr:UMP kinase [FCB group bacterium]
MGDEPRYSRILIKLSGEWLTGSDRFGINPEPVKTICLQLKRLQEAGVQIGIVVGGGNIFRGLKASKTGMNRITADHMGMLATVINALALQDQLENLGVPARVLTAVSMEAFADTYTSRRAISHLEKGRVVFLAAGTGHPYFTTDTAAALRASELGAGLILKGTDVDGVYSSDPKTDPKAELYTELTYLEALSKELGVMDAAAIALCKDNKIPLRVFNLGIENYLYRAGMGESVGTLVK